MVSWQGIPSHALILQSTCTVQQFFGLKAGVKNSVSPWTPHSLSFMGSLCVNIEIPNTLWLAAFNSKKMPSTRDLDLSSWQGHVHDVRYDMQKTSIWSRYSSGVCHEALWGKESIVSSFVLFGQGVPGQPGGSTILNGRSIFLQGKVESPRALSLPASKLNLIGISARDGAAKGWPKDVEAQAVPTLSFLVWKYARQP